MQADSGGIGGMEEDNDELPHQFQQPGSAKAAAASSQLMRLGSNDQHDDAALALGECFQSGEAHKEASLQLKPTSSFQHSGSLNGLWPLSYDGVGGSLPGSLAPSPVSGKHSAKSKHCPLATPSLSGLGKLTGVGQERGSIKPFLLIPLQYVGVWFTAVQVNDGTVVLG